MPSSYTVNLGIEKPATGEQAGSWGVTANTSYDTIDTAIDGNLSASISTSVYQLVTNNGGPPAPGVNKLVIWSGAQTAVGTVQIVPNTAKKIYIMQNKTTGGFALNFSQGSGSQFTLNPGYAAVVYTDGAGATASVNAALDSPQFANALFTGNVTINGALTFGSAQTFAQSVTFNGAVALNGATTAVNLTLNPSGSTQATCDLHYRTASGPLASLAIGSAGQFLSVASGLPAWVTIPPLAVGSPVSGSTANAVFFASSGGALAQDSTILINPGVGLGLGLLPTHSLHLGVNRAPEMWLDTNNPASQTRQVVWATNGAQRWELFSPVATESGSNVGSDLKFMAWDDPSTTSRAVLYLTRGTGNVTIGPPGGDQGARLAVFGDKTTQPALAVRGAPSQTAVLQAWQNSAGTNLSWIDAAGTFSGAVAASTLTASGNVTVSGGLSAGSFSSSGTLTVAGATVTGTLSAGTLSSSGLTVSGNATVSGTTSTQTLAVSGNASIAGTLPSLSVTGAVSSGSLSVSGNATVTGSLSASSMSLSSLTLSGGLSAGSVDSPYYSVTGQPGVLVNNLVYVKPGGTNGFMTFKAGLLIAYT